MPENTLPKTYDFNNTEERIYKMWEEGGYFKPTNDPNEPDHDPSQETLCDFDPATECDRQTAPGACHVRQHGRFDDPLPPHAGHPHPLGARHRSCRDRHPTQVERALREEGTSREEIGREAFLERTWAWKEEYGGHITRQIRRLGASCDWSRERFTLDEGLSKAVREAFVRLYEKDLIYRGPRLINWSPGLKTAVSDLEVEYHEEQGKLYYFKYMIAGTEDEFVPVATTRPETILGDTAVAVHPEDERYQKYIGKMALVPVLGREIPVIADEYVDREFGTGALKITPGHDPNDYEIGMRHNLEIISILDKAAKINENGGPYNGQDRFECREELVERYESRRSGDQRRRPHPSGAALATRRRNCRADGFHPMVRQDGISGSSRPGGRPGWPYPDRARTLHQSVLQLAGKYPGLVHLAPALVGPPHPGLVLR